MKRNFLLLILTASAGLAQEFEIGAVGGFSAVGASDVPVVGSVAAGVEFCAFCSGRYALFAEYSHLEGVGSNRTSGIRRFDLVGTGLRIQGRGRVRPFFDVGFVYGSDQYGSRGEYRHGNPGVVLAGGVAIRLKESLYIRPQYRAYGLYGFHGVSSGSVGLGLHF